MAISNISTANQSGSVKPSSNSESTHVAKKERSKDIRSDATVVTISTHARDLHRSEAPQPTTRDHVEQIRTLNRSDEIVQEKIAENSKEEARIVEAKQKVDEQLYKRINVVA